MCAPGGRWGKEEAGRNVMKMMMLIDDAMLDAMLDMHPHCCVELRARAMAGARRCRPQRPPPPAARTGGGGGAGPGAGHATPRTGDGATTDAHAPRPRDERRTRYVPSADVRRLSTDAFIIATVVPGASACVRLRLRLRTPWSVHRGWYRSRSAIPLSWPVQRTVIRSQ